jgi:hypothetical protein
MDELDNVNDALMGITEHDRYVAKQFAGFTAVFHARPGYCYGRVKPYLIPLMEKLMNLGVIRRRSIHGQIDHVYGFTEEGVRWLGD